MEIRETKKQPTMCIKVVTAVENLPQLLGEGYGEIMQYAGKHGIQPTGAPYAMYFNEDMENLQVEFGFPTAAPIEKEGRVEAGELPAGKALTDLHTGPYSSLEETYNRILAHAKEQRLVPTGVCYELYLNDPATTPPEELKTEVFFPLMG